MKKHLENLFYRMAMNSFDRYLRCKERLESTELCPQNYIKIMWYLMLCHVGTVKTNLFIDICKKIQGGKIS